MAKRQEITSLGTLFGAPHRQVDFYLVDGHPNADDDGPGTQANPFATLNGAIEKINQLVVIREGADVILHVATHTGAGYTWGRTLVGGVMGGSIAIVGDGAGQPGDDGFTELLALTQAPGVLTTAGAGGAFQITGLAGLGVNTFQGKTFEVLSGAAAGQRRTIRNHTDTDINLVYGITGFIANDEFRIVESSVEIQPALDVNSPMMMGVGQVGMTEAPVMGESRVSVAGPSALLAQLRFVGQPTIGLIAMGFLSSSVKMAGVELDLTTGFMNPTTQSSEWVAGYDHNSFLGGPQFTLPQTLGLAAGALDWTGWGLAIIDTVGSIFRSEITRFDGFLVMQSDNALLNVLVGAWRILGGALTATGTGTSNTNSGVGFAGSGTQALFDGQSTDVAVLLDFVGNNAGAAALKAIAGAQVLIVNTIVNMATTGIGVCATADQSGSFDGKDPGTITIGGGVIIGAASVAAMATYGGRVFYDANPTLSVVPATAEIAINITPQAAPDTTGTFAGLANGVALLSTTQVGNGSMIMKVT